MNTTLMKKPLTLAIAASLATLSVSYAQQTTETQATTSEEQLQTVEVVGKQDSYFEDTNTTALKGDFLDIETPYQVSSINRTLIEDLRGQRAEDALIYTTGVSRSGYLANSFVIRGNALDLQNIKTNGMSGLNSRWASPATANIEKIEVIKGPASVLYGNMETGGMINIETKLPQSEFAGSFQLSAQTYSTDVSGFGDDNGITGTLDVTGPVAGRDDLFYRFILTGENFDSFRNGINNENYSVYPSLLWEMDGSNSLLISMEATKENGTPDHGLAAVNNDINQIASIDTVYQEGGFDNEEGIALNADYSHHFDDGEYRFKWRSVWHNDERELYESSGVVDSTESLKRRHRHNYNDRDWHSFDTYLSKGFTTGSIEHDATFGLAGEYRMTDYDRRIYRANVSPNISIYNPVYGGTVTDVAGNRRETEYYSLGLYGQDKIALTDDLTLVGSGRVNYTKIDFTCLRDASSGGCVREENTAETTDFVGSLGAVYSLTDSLSVYGNVAQSFEPYTAERTDINGDPLDAEKSIQFETGVKYSTGDNLNASLSVYQINKDNVSQSLGSGNYELIGEVESKGVELDVQWLPTENWQIKAGYAYNDSYATEGSNDGLRTPFAPRNTAYLFTRYNLPQRVWGGEVGFSLGAHFRDEIKTDISPSKSVTLPSYTALDLGAYYEVNDWKWALNIENATDKTYFYGGSDDYRIYVGDPRKVTLTVTKKF